MGTTEMMQETLRYVLLEVADAYRALSEDAPDAALDHLRNVFEYAKRHVETTNQESAKEMALKSSLATYGVGDGSKIDTIVGYMIRTGQYEYDLEPEDYIQRSLVDSRVMTKYVKKYGYQDQLRKVIAPTPFHEFGIETVNVYPVEFLKEVFGG